MKVFGSDETDKFERISWWLLNHIASNPERLMQAMALIVGAGLAFSFFGYSTGFQRSGAVLVSLAVAAVYLNHSLTKERVTLQNMQQNTKQLSGGLDKITNHIASSTSLTGTDLANASASIHDLKVRTAEAIPKMLKTEKSIVTLEFLAGFFGALIWGFGDLPFR